MKFDYKEHLNNKDEMISIFGYDLFLEEVREGISLGFSIDFTHDSYAYFKYQFSLRIYLIKRILVFNFMFWR